jgi:hypothetical protein
MKPQKQKMVLPLLIFYGLGVCGLGVASASQAFVLLGINKSKLPATEQTPTVEFLYNPSGDVPSMSKKEELLNGQYATYSDAQLFPVLLQLAFDQWNQVRGSYLRMSVKASTTVLDRNQDDRINVIVAEKSASASSAAFATPNTNPDDPNEIYDCDISISMSATSAASLLETLTHEIGHCVGLGHPHNNYGAIMSYSRGGSSYKLGADDKAGIIFLYPDPNYGGDEQKELIGCGSIHKGHISIVSILMALGFPCLFVLGRKRRGKTSLRGE